ncbi:MAG: hypothetical protein SFX73_05325 [Kofleriaceae bacterium]|nr:hypothetical protein [Kofleriaceae bacterium]
MKLAPVLLVCALAASASANVWERALDEKATVTRERYEQALATGDTLAQRANARGLSRTTGIQLVDRAIAAYMEAGKLRKDQGEPYFRIASVLEIFFIDCDDTYRFGTSAPPVTCPPAGTPVDPARMKQTLDAWDQFEARAQLDPRLADALFQRAILRTKLVDGSKASQKHLEGAAADYRAILDRADGMTAAGLDGVWGNLAETYMMLGNLEEAIDAYRTALRMGAGSSTALGLAVALDRDENGPAALDIVRRISRTELLDFQNAFVNKRVFFVPEGEEYYYFALIYEAAGADEMAIMGWQRFLASGAHPQYQPRAKQHLDALQAKVRTKPASRRPAFDPFDGYP